jgi:hypothetical protein
MPSQYLEGRIAALKETVRRIEALTEKQAKDLQIRFQRLAQIQAVLDERRIASENVRDSLLRRRPQDR